MRRTRLPDPVPRSPDREGASGGTDAGRGRSVEHVSLGAPSRADPTPRSAFDPVYGRFRRLERAAAALLADKVWPRVPGLARIHDRALRRHLTLAEADVLVPALSGAFDGCRVLLVSDLHAGPFVSGAALRETMARLLEPRPDLVLVGGDVVTQRFSEFDDARRALAVLEAPLGVWGVLGNHDLYAAGDAARAVAALEGSGVTFLVNRSVSIRKDGARIRLAGIDDWNIGRPDLDAAMAGDGTDDPVVLLSHNPDAAFRAASRGAAMVLSGHTHGGQIRLPGLPVLVRMSRFRLDEGRYRAGACEIVVSRGLGAVGVPFRWGCPPEAVLLVLRAPRDEA